MLKNVVSDVMIKTNKMLDKAAKTSTSILLVGEKGVGKSGIAREIHDASPRAKEPFVTVRPDDTDVKEKIQQAGVGTLFIDELQDMDILLQEELLKSLRRRPCRVISASSMILEPLIKQKRFLEKLYRIVCVSQIKIPSLRERIDDLPMLVEDIISRKLGGAKKLSECALEKLSGRSWPGNCMELENVLIYAFRQSEGDCIEADDLPEWAIEDAYCSEIGESLHDELFRIATVLLKSDSSSAKVSRMKEYERLVLSPLIKASMVLTADNKSQAAQLLGINRNTLTKLITEYEIENK